MKRLQQIVCEKEILKLGGVDKGFRWERTNWKGGEPEKIFYQQWKKENIPFPWLNQGQGILQNLFAISPQKWYHGYGWKLIINKRDRYIVATVIQWLGTAVGWCWLEETLRKCGYRIVKMERTESNKVNKKVA